MKEFLVYTRVYIHICNTSNGNSNNSYLCASEELVDANHATRPLHMHTVNVRPPILDGSIIKNNAPLRASLTCFVLWASNGKNYFAFLDSVASNSAMNPKVVVDFRVQKSDVVASAGPADTHASRRMLNEHMELNYNIGKIKHTHTFWMFPRLKVRRTWYSAWMGCTSTIHKFQDVKRESCTLFRWLRTKWRRSKRVLQRTSSHWLHKTIFAWRDSSECAKFWIDICTRSEWFFGFGLQGLHLSIKSMSTLMPHFEEPPLCKCFRLSYSVSRKDVRNSIQRERGCARQSESVLLGNRSRQNRAFFAFIEEAAIITKPGVA